MLRFNYHHLFYFWSVAREGSVARASERLRLAPPTLSSQIRSLEGSLGEKLFERSGRGLRLTEIGRVVLGYADEIFTLGDELAETLKLGGAAGRPLRLTVGVADAVPKLVAHRLLEPALRGPHAPRLVVREGPAERLIGELVAHALDLVLTDGPMAAGSRRKVLQHALGECGVSFFAAPSRARRLARDFPRSLAGEPFLLPAEPSHLRRELLGWFHARGVAPRVVGEFDDSALMNVFGQAGLGAFAAPAVIERDVVRRHAVRVVGRTEEARDRYYATTVERRIPHPSVVAALESARSGFTGIRSAPRA